MFILFLASQFALLSVVLPWATLNTDVDINSQCTLPVLFQFRLWGGACNTSWEDLKDHHTSNYFAMVHVLTEIRIFCLVSVILLNIALMKRKSAIVMCVISFTLSMMATSMYYTEQHTTMVIPHEILSLQGNGFVCQIIAASFTLAYVLIAILPVSKIINDNESS